VTLIRPSRGWRDLDLRELWESRELLFFLIWRDVKVRYKQTALGAAWAIVNPVLTMIVFSIFFGGLAGIPSDGVPYPIFSLAALVPWTFFASGLTLAANSMVGDQSLITKIYFPRLTIPMAAVLSNLVDVALSFLVLLGLMRFYRISLVVQLMWLPLFVFFALVATLGVGLWLAALNVRYRDIRYITPYLIQVWLFVTPVVYPSSLLAEPWRTVYMINPLAGVVEGFRWTLLGTSAPPALAMMVSALCAVVIVASGALYFQRVEKSFADII
jgi:homopolymeric O-antigen transport system permease protein